MAEILIVDDSPLTQNRLGKALTDLGVTIATAGDGRAALDYLRSDPAVTLMISDIHMPGMDGITLVELVKNEMPERAIKIIMISTEGAGILKGRSKDLNIVAWVVKPFGLDIAPRIYQILKMD